MVATPNRTTPNINLTDSGFNFVTINLEPIWLPVNTETTQSIQKNQSGVAAVAMCETKLEVPEKVTIIAEVAAAIFISIPAM